MNRLASIFLALLWCSFSFAEAPKAKRDFMHFVENEQGASLETAIVHLKNQSGIEVDLVGAIHIADKTYYAALNQRFTRYDAVLYELVGGPMPKLDGRELLKRTSDPRMAWLGQMQSTLKDSLNQAKNFVHADMTADQFFAAKELKSESFLGLLAKAWKIQSKLEEGKAEGAQPGLVKLLEILCRKDSADELKRLIGREFDSMEPLINGMEAEGGTVIVGERNKIALQVLERQIARGQHKLAIFYGAAHLPDMESKLVARGFTRDEKTEWLKAWDLPPETKAVGK